MDVVQAISRDHRTQPERWQAQQDDDDGEDVVDRDEPRVTRGRTKTRASLRAPPELDKNVTYKVFKHWTTAWKNYAKALKLVEEDTVCPSKCRHFSRIVHGISSKCSSTSLT